MAFFFGLQAGSCTTIVVPGWAAVAVVLVAAAPRAVRETVRARRQLREG